MTTRPPLTLALLIAFAAFGPVPAAFGLKPTTRGPQEWQKDSPCGRSCFVWLPPGGTGVLAKKYPASGLYEVDGPAVPFWKADPRSHLDAPGTVSLHSAGDHLVLAIALPGSISQEALHFFHKGRLLRLYAIEELVDNRWWLRRLGRGLAWRGEDSLDEARKTFRLETSDGNSFVFDITTGEIVHESRPGRFINGFLSAFLLVNNVLLIWWIFRRKGRSPKQPDAPTSQPPNGGHQGIMRAKE